MGEARQRLATRSVPVPGARGLDVGCGTGQVALLPAELGYAVTGIDASKATLDIAAAKLGPGPRASFVVSDVQSLALGDHAFDAAVASTLFQHAGTWRLAVAEIVRVTRPGGHFVHINERGAFRHSIRRRFEDRADQRGFTDRYPGPPGTTRSRS